MSPRSFTIAAVAACAGVFACAPCALAQVSNAAYPMPPHRPFIDPIELHQWWFVLLIPMALLVSMTYKAVRLPTLERYWRNVCIMTMQIILGMIGLGAATYFVVFVVAKMVAERGT